MVEYMNNNILNKIKKLQLLGYTIIEHNDWAISFIDANEELYIIMNSGKIYTGYQSLHIRNHFIYGYKKDKVKLYIRSRDISILHNQETIENIYDPFENELLIMLRKANGQKYLEIRNSIGKSKTISLYRNEPENIEVENLGNKKYKLKIKYYMASSLESYLVDTDLNMKYDPDIKLWILRN